MLLGSVSEQDLSEESGMQSVRERIPLLLNLIQFSADRRESFICCHSELSLFIGLFSSSELTFELGGFSCILWRSYAWSNFNIFGGVSRIFVQC